MHASAHSFFFTQGSQASGPASSSQREVSTRVRRVSELSAREREELGISCSADAAREIAIDVAYLVAAEDLTYWDEQGAELQPSDQVLIPVATTTTTKAAAPVTLEPSWCTAGVVAADWLQEQW